MKILHINASYKPAYIYGGPTVSVAKLCEALEEEGLKQKAEGTHSVESFASLFRGRRSADSGSTSDNSISVTVYTTLANGKEELPYENGAIKIVNGVEVHYFKRITKDHSHLSPTFLFYLWKTVKQFDIIHVHAWWNLVSVGAAIICWLKCKQYILSPRGTLSSYSFYNRKSKLKRLFHFLIGKPLLKRAIFQVSSEKEKRDIENIVGVKSIIKVIPNFVELQKAGQVIKKPFDSKRLELLFFSRIEEKKGLEFLLNACAQLEIPYHLTIGGTGDLTYIQKLKSLVESLNISGDITWLGQVDIQQKFDTLSQYDLLVLPSYDENFANVVIESLACGTPAVLSPNVGLADYVREKKLGWICEQNADSIADCIAHLFKQEKEVLIHKSKIAQKIIADDYAEETLRNIYIHFYQNLVPTNESI